MFFFSKKIMMIKSINNVIDLCSRQAVNLKGKWRDGWKKTEEDKWLSRWKREREIVGERKITDASLFSQPTNNNNNLSPFLFVIQQNTQYTIRHSMCITLSQESIRTRIPFLYNYSVEKHIQGELKSVWAKKKMSIV
jgi:hypothetical protein